LVRELSNIDGEVTKEKVMHIIDEYTDGFSVADIGPLVRELRRQNISHPVVKILEVYEAEVKSEIGAQRYKDMQDMSIITRGATAEYFHLARKGSFLFLLWPCYTSSLFT